MSQRENNDESDPDELTFAESKRERKEKIAELEKGDRQERKLASLMVLCCKKRRCNLIECPVCARRRERAGRRTPTPKSLIRNHIFDESIACVEVIGKRRPLNDARVKSLAASMKEIGQLAPITIREVGGKVVLVSGFYRLAAAKRLGWKSISCVYMVGDKTDARMWQLIENFSRAELTVLERAEHVNELRTLLQTKRAGGQVAPPGGVQPKDAGIKKTAKTFGITREEVRRSKAIAGICPKAKTAAKCAKLDDSQRALLEIARQPTSAAQLKVIEEIIERKRVDHARHLSVVEQQAAHEVAALKSDLAKYERTRESVKAGIAYKRQRLQELENASAAGCGDVGITINGSTMASCQDQDETATDPAFEAEPFADVRNAHFEDQKLSDDEQRQLANLDQLWANASPLVRLLFLAKHADRYTSGQQLSTIPAIL